LISANASHGVSSDDLELLFKKKILSPVRYGNPMHMQPIFASYPYYGNNVAESLFENGLCLPSGSNLTDNRLRIATIISKVFKTKVALKLPKKLCFR
jgi:dTDP-4-amino-4,6-dideoxygalactose transaminase